MAAVNQDEASIYDILRQKILAEEYYPGQKMSENVLAQEFGCSRTPVREALKNLEQNGLIEIKPQSGAYVREITTKNYADLLEVRSYLEGLAFRLAVEHAQDSQLEELKQLVIEMDRVVETVPIDMQRYADFHYRFHHGIIEASGNELLVQMFDRLNLRTSHMFLRSMNKESAARTQEEHYRILKHLTGRDVKGEKFIVDHLWKKKKYLGY